VSRRPTDPRGQELAAIRRIFAALDTLPPDGRRRVLSYVWSRAETDDRAAQAQVEKRQLPLPFPGSRQVEDEPHGAVGLG